MFDPMPSAPLHPFGPPQPAPSRSRRWWVIAPIATAVVISGVVTTTLLVRASAVETEVRTQISETGDAVQSILAEVPIPTVGPLEVPQISQLPRIPVPSVGADGLIVELPSELVGAGLDELPTVPAEIPVVAPPVVPIPVTEPVPAEPEQPALPAEPVQPEHVPAADPHHQPEPERHQPPVVSIHHFSASTTSVHCADESEAYPVTVSWSSSNASQAWFGVDTDNAQQAPLQEVPTSGSFTWDFFCSNTSTVFTVSVAGDAGTEHRSVTITRA